MTDIVAINRHTGRVLDDAGEIGEVIDWLDDEGDPCDAQNAVSAIAFCGEQWYALRLDNFKKEVLQ